MIDIKPFLKSSEQGGQAVLLLVSIFRDHPDIAYLDRYAHACCSPFGAAEQAEPVVEQDAKPV
jgi:hypothetical protein